jgi:hypothetical protein
VLPSLIIQRSDDIGYFDNVRIGGYHDIVEGYLDDATPLLSCFYEVFAAVFAGFVLGGVFFLDRD